MKLGEVLVKEGLITNEHLRLALERQVIFGGRIGTNIVELGILTEDEFTKFLSRHLKIPMVDPSNLVNINEETIAAISKELAEKYKAVPFKKEKNRLHVAILDPKDMNTVDVFRFVSGYDIIPYAASELRVLYALEKYYGIKRDLRYINIFDRMKEDSPPKVDAATDSEELKKIKEAFANVRDKEDIADLLINKAQKVAKRTALFIIKGGHITGWKSKGMSVEGININISAASASGGGTSIFSEALAKRTYHRGPVMKTQGNEEFIRLLSGTPQDSLTIPINIRDRAIAILYSDNGNDAVLDANLNYLNTLVALASIAFEILILRKKIIDM